MRPSNDRPRSNDGPPVRGVVAVICRQTRLLVIRRSPHVAAGGALCFPGGAIERGESEAAALVRELDEELRLSVQPVRRLWESLTPWNVQLFWWLATIDSAAIPVPNPREVAEFHWLAPEVMLTCEDLLVSNREFLAALAGGNFSLA